MDLKLLSWPTGPGRGRDDISKPDSMQKAPYCPTLTPGLASLHSKAFLPQIISNMEKKHDPF
jgi:hypothetical protein